MSTREQALDLWESKTPQEDHEDAPMIMGGLKWADYPVETVELALAMLDTPPFRLPRTLRPIQLLALAVVMVNTEVARPVDGESPLAMAMQVSASVFGLHTSAQAAAAASVADLGGWRKVNLRDHEEMALADYKEYNASPDLMRNAELCCANTDPGRKWRNVIGLGWVRYTNG